MKTTTLLALFLAFVSAASAATRTWTGNASGLWSNTGNWSPNGLPDPTDDLVFPSSDDNTSVNDLSGVTVRSLTFTYGHAISGNPMSVAAGITADAGGAFDTDVAINVDLTLAGVQTFRVSSGELFLNGGVNLNGRNLTFDVRTGGLLNVSGVISGMGNLYKIFGGTLELGGNTANTYSGFFTINRGLVTLNKQTGSAGNAVTGALTIGTPVDVATVQLLHSHQIADNASITIHAGGLLDINNHTERLGPLTLHGGPFQNTTTTNIVTGDGGTVFLPADVEVPDGYSKIVGLVGLYLDVTFDTPQTLSRVTIEGRIFGDGAIVKEGFGDLLLAGDNPGFIGPIVVRGGTLIGSGAKPFGDTRQGVTVDHSYFTGGSIRVLTSVVGEPLELRGDAPGAFFRGVTWTGPIDVQPLEFAYFESGDFGSPNAYSTLAGPITGSGTILFDGYDFELSGSDDNSFHGWIRVQNRSLRLNKSGGARPFDGLVTVGLRAVHSPTNELCWLANDQLPSGATFNLIVETNGILNLNGHNQALNASKWVTLHGGRIETGTGTLTLLGGNRFHTTAYTAPAVINGTLLLSGTLNDPVAHPLEVDDGPALNDLEINAVISGSRFATLVKNGPGRMRLSGASPFSGPINVNAGTLAVNHNNGLGAPSATTTVQDGATLLFDVNASSVLEPLVLNGAGVGGTNGALNFSAGILSQNGNITLGSASAIRTEASANGIVSGVISGTGPLTKIGAGTLQIGGGSGAANTYTGDTLVNAGTVVLFKPAFTQAIPGNLVIGGEGLRGTTPATVRHFSHDQIWAHVTVNAGSLLDVNGYEEYLLTLTLNGGGDLQTGAGLLTVDAGNSITVNPGVGFASSTISGRLGLRTGNHNISVGSFPLSLLTAPELDIPAQVLPYNGIANLHKNGSGDLRLGGANTFTGTLYVDGGRVIAAHNSALGTTQGSTVVQTNGTLVLDGGIATAEFLILDSAAFPSLVSMSGSNVVNAGINLIRPNNGIEVQPANGYLQVLGRIGSVGGLTKLGPGTLQFWGTVGNDYAGLTVVSNGVIEANRTDPILRVNRISIPGDFTIGDDSTASTVATLRAMRAGQIRLWSDADIHRSGLFDLRPNATTSLRIATGAGRINLGAANTSLTISNDVSFDFDGSISGAGALNKYGRQSSMHFTGDSAFSGPTTIWEGFFRMDGSAPNSPVTVKPDASLRGDGQVGGLTVESGGIVSPNSEVPGHRGADLQMSSANFLAGGILGLALYGPHPTGGNDSLLVNGPVTLGGTRLSSGFQYAPREGDVITLIRKTTAGPITGTFTGYPEGAQRLHGEIPVVMSYVGGDGNDVTVTVTNLAAGAGGSQITSGNGNGLIEPDECNLIFLGVQNRRNTAILLSNVVLRSTTPSALVTIASVAYPTIPATSIRSNLTPFQIRTLPTHPCGAPVTVELQVTIANEGTFAIPFTLLGGTSCTNGGGACESCTIVSGTFMTNTPTLFRRLLATGAPSICFPEKPCPGVDEGTNLPPARYITHTFTNTTGSEACLTAQLHFDCPTAPVGALHVAAYLGDVDPAAACLNYLGESGGASLSGHQPFSFRVPAGSNFVLVVTTRAEDIGCDSYWLELFGLPCAPPTLRIADDAAPGNVRLHWSTAYPGWRLQSVSSLNGPAPLPFQNLPAAPGIVGGRYNVTNPATDVQRIYRLAQ